MLLFADDLKFVRIMKSPGGACLLQSDLNSLSNWCDQHYLAFNVNKCKIMSANRTRSNL